MFVAEALGLVTMARSSSVVRIPKPLDMGILPKVGDIGPGSFLVMEWVDAIEFGPLRSESQAKLGLMVAEMHACSDSAFATTHNGRFGFPINNWLSLNAQINDWKDSWADFFAARLQRQVERAYISPSYGGATGAGVDALLEFSDKELQETFCDLRKILPELLGPERLPGLRPALLHGDLWIGNTLADAEGPVLIDPACYYGHSEMDLAIMPLFKGFTPEFFEAYHARVPKVDGFEGRQRLYQTYHWLSHFNLFGDPRAKDEAIKLARQVLREDM